MDIKKFKELLKLLGKEKKVEEETKILCGAELRERTGKTFYEIWMEGKNE